MFCRKCKTHKDVSEFRKDKYNRVRDCKSCLKAYYKTKDYTATKRNFHYKTKYGISFQQFEDMCINNDFKCDICFKQCNMIGKNTPRFSWLVIDHCHNTGKIRGLLCQHCNTTLGNVRDDVDLLQKCVEYLNRV